MESCPGSRSDEDYLKSVARVTVDEENKEARKRRSRLKDRPQSASEYMSRVLRLGIEEVWGDLKT